MATFQDEETHLHHRGALLHQMAILDLDEEDNGSSDGSGSTGTRRPFKVVNWSREIKLGLTAASLHDLVERGKRKLELDPQNFIRIVLEMDGTEIDDNDYFNTLEPDTTLMLLVDEEKWTPYRSVLTLGLALEPRSGPDDLDGLLEGRSGSTSTPISPVEELVWRLHQDLSFFPWLTPKELDTIAKMDRDEMKKLIPDEKFLEFLQDLCERYLQDKDKGRDDEITTLLHDPIKLIRMYSKYSHCLHFPYDQNSRRTN